MMMKSWEDTVKVYLVLCKGLLRAWSLEPIDRHDLCNALSFLKDKAVPASPCKDVRWLPGDLDVKPTQSVNV